MKRPNYITNSGLVVIREELNRLLYEDRPDMVRQVAEAAAHGDRSENAEYIYGKKRLREIDRRIHYLQTRLDNVEVIDPKTLSGDKVQFGATVTVADEEGVESTYQIVGEDEFDATKGRISWRSPLARAMLGRTEGDVVVVKKPKGVSEIEIVSVVYK